MRQVVIVAQTSAQRLSSRLFTKKSMSERGIALETQKHYLELVHRLGNLQFLTAIENEEKSDEEFETWIKTRHEGFLTRQLIPKNKSLWKLEHFEKFVEAREELIRKRFETLFSSPRKDAAQATLFGGPAL